MNRLLVFPHVTTFRKQFSTFIALNWKKKKIVKTDSNGYGPVSYKKVDSFNRECKCQDGKRVNKECRSATAFLWLLQYIPRLKLKADFSSSDFRHLKWMSEYVHTKPCGLNDQKVVWNPNSLPFRFKCSLDFGSDIHCMYCISRLFQAKKLGKWQNNFS